MKSKRNYRLALLAALTVLVVAACMPKSPEEKVAQLRSYYKASLVGFIVEAQPELAEQPVDGTEPAETAEPEGIEPADGDAEGMAGEEPAVPIRQNVLLDILIQHDSPERLPGVTLDIERVDASQALKDSWKLWVDTSKLPKATGNQFVHRLEDLDYVEGDGFSVEVRSPVPPEERGEYKEFSMPGGG